MKSAREILDELGFNPDAPAGSRRAFLNHLRREAARLSPRPAEAKPEPAPPGPTEQLSFDPKLLRRG